MVDLPAELRAALQLPDDAGPATAAAAALLRDAVREGVSDIHLTPGPTGLEILYRRDGVLRPAADLPPEWSARLVGRIKVLAGLLTYRVNVPQDGQIPSKESGTAAGVRVSILPTIHGEKAVLRFFPPGRDGDRVDGLGLPEDIVRRLRARAGRSEGSVLLTGPSGSGKTTTIYAILREIAAESPRRHVVTLEDPVEQVVAGITQTQIDAGGNVTFASGLRAALRQDPQVLMIGEIRDRETARTAMEAGLTGHLVISTVHAGTAAGVILRLLEMGIEPYVLTASLSCLLAQRLVRRRCGCAGGCDACRGTGFRGRQVVAELLEVTEPVRKVILGSPSRTDLERVAEAEGMVPLSRAGASLVERGITTREELDRVLT